MRDERKINIHDANNTDPQAKVKDTLAFFKHSIRSDEEKLRRKIQRDGVGNEKGGEEERLEREEENKRRKTRRKNRRVGKTKKE